jgi:hypothetical protein
VPVQKDVEPVDNLRLHLAEQKLSDGSMNIFEKTA